MRGGLGRCAQGLQHTRDERESGRPRGLGSRRYLYIGPVGIERAAAGLGRTDELMRYSVWYAQGSREP